MLTFTPFSAKMILTGEKTQTRRYSKARRCKPDAIHYAQKNRFDVSTRFARIRIISVGEWDGKTISDADVKAEGFTSADAFHTAYNMLNDGCWHPYKKHFFYNFEVVECAIRGWSDSDTFYMPFEKYLENYTRSAKCVECDEDFRRMVILDDIMCGRCDYENEVRRLVSDGDSKN